jgi:signal transduction histidine kinase
LERSAVFKENQERLEKDRIGLMHDIFASYLGAVQFDPERVQNELETLSRLNPDIIKFRVARDTREGVVSIAALNNNVIGIIEAESSAYRIAQIHVGESIITPRADTSGRYWQSFRLVTSDSGDDYYIFTETSLARLDALFAARIRTAYYWLFGLLAIVLMLILRHVRLIDYSYLYRDAKRANEMKDLFTNMIAHELRAPLTAMRGYASMIRDNNTVQADVKEHARRIEDSSQRLILIVNDLLDVARIQSGKLAVTKEKVNISEVVVSVVNEQGLSAQKKHIELLMEGINDALYVIGDTKRLHQALTNLVSNAIKYTQKGSIEISIKDRRDRVEIRVKDTGMGIEAKDQKELFAPFFRVQSDDVSAITGTGLGMWITKQLIELMGGSIGVESIRGVGTHVVVTLPKER